jgi:Aerotolerance regulator N-terminal/von Willebrand factor type A domain
MGLLAPWFLAGAAALGLPIYLHMLRRHTSTPHPFASLMFFERRTQSSIKHRRLRYLLLLALRLALLFLLVLAFANPFISRPASTLAGDKLVILAIDDSFSMRAGTRLPDARRQAQAVLDARNPSARVQIMALDSTVHILTQPSRDAGTLRAAIDSVQPGDAHATLDALARVVRSIADSVHTPIELHLFSDMQKSSMPASFGDIALPANVSLVLHPVAQDVPANWVVETVSAPGQVWDTKKARVQAVIAGYHTKAAKRTVSLVVAGKTIATRMADVPADGRATVEFDSLDVPYGFTRCEVRIDSADSLPDDDIARFAVERTDPKRVLFVHEPTDSRSELYFRSALVSAAEAAFTVESVPVSQVSTLQPTQAQYAFVVLSDLLATPAAFEQSLVKYVREGGGVLVSVGTSAARAPTVPVFGGRIIDSRSYARDGARFVSVGQVDAAYPSIEKADRWAGVKFFFAVRVDPGDATVAARLSDQTPVLLEKRIGEGRVVLFTSGLDNVTNDFPQKPIWVPLIDRTARYLSGTESRSGSRVVDSFLELRTAKERSVSVEVTDPDGKRPLSLSEASTAENYQLARAGFYELRLANGRRDMVGVNPDRRESDLSQISEEALSLWRGTGGQQAQQAASGGPAANQTAPFGVWWYVMVLVLATAVAESAFSSQYLGTQREGP